MLKKITFDRPVLAKLFANAKPLLESCVLRATGWCGGKRKDFWGWWIQVKIPTLPITSCQRPQTSHRVYKPQFHYLQNGKTQPNHFSLIATVRIRWANICKALKVPGSKQAQLLLDAHTGDALNKQAPHDLPPEKLQRSSVFLFPGPSPLILPHPSCHELSETSYCPLCLNPPTKLYGLQGWNQKPHRERKDLPLTSTNPHVQSVHCCSSLPGSMFIMIHWGLCRYWRWSPPFYQRSTSSHTVLGFGTSMEGDV